MRREKNRFFSVTTFLLRELDAYVCFVLWLLRKGFVSQSRLISYLLLAPVKRCLRKDISNTTFSPHVISLYHC